MPGVIENLLGLFNVQDYGAKPDGRDISLRWSDVLAAIPAGGGTVVFPPGAYQVNSNLTWQGRNNVTVWLTAGVTFTGPGSLPANAGTNRVLDFSGVTGTFPPSGPAGGVLAGTFPNPTLAAPPAPTTSAVGDAAAAGAGPDAALSDHLHGREGFGGAAVVQSFGDVAAAGAAATPARSDHRHGMPGSPINHSVNGLLNVWQRTVQAYTANNGPAGPDGVFITLAGTDTISCTQDTAHVDAANGAQFCLACAFVLGTGGGASGVQSMLGGFKLTTDAFRFMRGKQVTRTWRVRASVPNAVRLAVTTDGTGGATTYSAFHPGDDTWQPLSVTTPVIPADATFVQFKVVGSASTTFYVGAHSTVLGTVAADAYQAALSAFDDKARCQRYYEVATLRVVGYNAAANQIASWLAFKVAKAVTPSVTLGDLGSSNTTGGNSTPVITADGISVQTNVNVTGQAVLYVNCAAEANP